MRHGCESLELNRANRSVRGGRTQRAWSKCRVEDEGDQWISCRALSPRHPPLHPAEGDRRDAEEAGDVALGQAGQQGGVIGAHAAVAVFGREAEERLFARLLAAEDPGGEGEEGRAGGGVLGQARFGEGAGQADDHRGFEAVGGVAGGAVLFGYAVGVVPYAVIVAAGGAASAPDNLTPAILTCIGVSVTLLLAWTVLVRRGGRAPTG